MKNRDTLIMTVAATLAGVITHVAQAVFWFGGSMIRRPMTDDDDGEPGALAQLGVLIVAPLAATLLQLAISRAREFDADASAAQITGDPDGLASALGRLEVGNRYRPLDHSPATAHLFIVNFALGTRAGSDGPVRRPTAHWGPHRAAAANALRGFTLARAPYRGPSVVHPPGASHVIPVIILLGVALAISLAFNLGLIGGGQKPSPQAAANTSSSSKSEPRSDDDRARKLENDLEKKKKELEEVKKAQAELKDELKTAKKKLHDQREGDKSGDDLLKARAEVERAASMQLESTRAELADRAGRRAEAEDPGRGQEAPRAPCEKPKEKKEEVKVERPAEGRHPRDPRALRRREGPHRRASRPARRTIARRRTSSTASSRASRRRWTARPATRSACTRRPSSPATSSAPSRCASTARILENDLLKRAIKDLEKKSGVHAGRHRAER